MILLRQKFCSDKHTFVATKHVFCRDKHVFVATKMILVASPANDAVSRWHVRVVGGGDEVVCDGSRHVLVHHTVGGLEQVLSLRHQEVLEPCTPTTIGNEEQDDDDDNSEGGECYLDDGCGGGDGGGGGEGDDDVHDDNDDDVDVTNQTFLSLLSIINSHHIQVSKAVISTGTELFGKIKNKKIFFFY